MCQWSLRCWVAARLRRSQWVEKRPAETRLQSIIWVAGEAMTAGSQQYSIVTNQPSSLFKAACLAHSFLRRIGFEQGIRQRSLCHLAPAVLKVLTNKTIAWVGKRYLLTLARGTIIILCNVLIWLLNL